MNLPLEGLMRDSAVAAPRPGLVTELFSFVFVGGLAAISFVGLSMLMVGLVTAVPAWIVSACCYALFIVPVYLAHRHYSFRSNMPHAVALPRYVAVQMSALALASLFSFLCYSVLGMETGVAALLVIALT